LCKAGIMDENVADWEATFDEDKTSKRDEERRGRDVTVDVK